MVQRNHNTNEEQTTGTGKQSNGYLTTADFWKAQYEKEKEINQRFDEFEHSIEGTIEKLIKPIADTQSKTLESMSGLQSRMSGIEARLGNVETLKDQKFKKSLEWMVTGRGVLMLVLSGGGVFSLAWAWLQNFFQ